ncbi:MAG: UDP-N-acetylmuramoyl-tripeptide--D-alanyl-D-alanine ligase [Verrucomicrobia bacterium]|nr:UDP-N-acetylmuramoyl-tripeptide--D-alanyl-D-alanine ligase [Verrucomicrobiota bacterium]
MRNLSLQAIAQALGVVLDSDLQVAGYQIDSRLVQAGDLFFALKGEKTDGHRHLKEVRAKGAVAAVVSKSYEGPAFGLVLVPVEDVAESLRELAKWSLSLKEAQIIGITGSVGKTTTKEFVAALLEGKFRVYKTPGSYNTKLTLPMTVLNRTDEEVLVLEMGMSEPGDIARLVEIAPPDIAVLTKVALAHAAFFPGGIEEIAKGKMEIFSHPKTRAAIFPFGMSVETKGQKVNFSLEERSADYFLSFAEGRFYVDERGVRAYQFDLPFRESHLLHNFLAAVAVARQMKMEWDEINKQIGQLKLPKMRFEQFERDGVHFVNDAYNANPESMRAALSNLPQPKEEGKRIAVLGTMRELGSFSEESHREIGHFAQKYADHLLVLGEEAKPLCEAFSEVKKPAEHFMSHKKLAQRLAELMRPGDVVLIKGSRGMELEKIFEFLA